MAHYRRYVIGCDGHPIKAVDLNRTDDDEARKRAEQMVDGHSVELREYARRITRFDGNLEFSGPAEINARFLRPNYCAIKSKNAAFLCTIPHFKSG